MKTTLLVLLTALPAFVCGHGQVSEVSVSQKALLVALMLSQQSSVLGQGFYAAKKEVQPSRRELLAEKQLQHIRSRLDGHHHLLAAVRSAMGP